MAKKPSNQLFVNISASKRGTGYSSISGSVSQSISNNKSTLSIQTDSLTFLPDSSIINPDTDNLTGGKIKDNFVLYDSSEGIDIITELNTKQEDQLQFDLLTEGQFSLGASDRDANDTFIYNNKTGNLFFELNSTGGQIGIQLTGLNNLSSISLNDTSII